jgi:hypothetical protein
MASSLRSSYSDPTYRNSIAFVDDYYRLWNDREYGAMYTMLSARMQHKNPYDQYVKYHSMVAHLDVTSTPGYEPDVVNVRIVSRDREKDGSVTENVNEGRWFLTTEYGKLKLDSQDAHTAQAATVVEAPPPQTSTYNEAPPPAPAADSSTAVSFVRQYYQLWNERDYSDMYQMLSTNMQRKHPYGDYLKYHSLVERIAADVGPSDSPFVVNVHIVSLDREKDGSTTENVNEGQWFLTVENAALKLDDQKVHDVR